MSQVVGPFGIWPFPILNFILQMLNQRKQTPIAQTQVGKVNNVETWEWEDWKGKQRKFVIHREVTSE